MEQNNEANSQIVKSLNLENSVMQMKNPTFRIFNLTYGGLMFGSAFITGLVWIIYSI